MAQSVSNSGISYCDGTYRQQRMKSPTCVIEYVVAGTGTLQIDGCDYRASAGDVYILPMGSDQLYASDKTDPWEKIFMNCHGPLVRSLLRDYRLDGRVLYAGCPMESLFRELFTLSGSRLPEEQRMEQCALKFHEICIRISNWMKQESPDSEARLLKNMIDGRLDYMYSNAELAEAIYRSEDYVIKLFKHTFGQTPHAYAITTKINTALRLLTDTNLSIQEITGMLGYEDSGYFSHVFCQHTGQAPSKLRGGRYR